MVYEVIFFSCHLISFTETRVINLDLRYPFLSFSLDEVLLLIGCILTQQRIVFLSSSYSLLTPVIEVCTLSNLWKPPTLCDATAGSPRNDVWKTTCHYPDLGRASDWLKQISWGNHWWRRKTSAVFSGCTLRRYNWTVFVLYGPVAFKNVVGFTTL